MPASHILRALPTAPLMRASASRFAVAIPAARRSYSSTTTTNTPNTASTPPPVAETPTATSPSTASHTPATIQPRKHAGGYFVARSPSNNLPIYEDGKKHTTLLRKIEGDAHKLKLELISQLKFDEDKIAVNPTTNHIRIKGLVKAQLRPVLINMGF